MDITFRQENEIYIVKLEGDFSSATSPAFKGFIENLLTQGAKKIILDMQDMSHITSAGIQCLIVLLEQLKANNVRICLCCVKESVTKLLKMFNLENDFPILDNRKKAMEILA